MNPTNSTSFADRLNFVPPCLRGDNAIGVTGLDTCVYQSILYYIELLLVIVAIAAFFYIIFAGIQMATAFGNESKYAQAKSALTNAIIGIVIATLAYTIVGFFTSLLGVDSRFQFITKEGEQVSNNEAIVTGKYQIRPLTTQPGDGALTEEEYKFIKDSGTQGSTLSASGANSGLYLLGATEFRAELIKADGGVVTASVGKRGAEYYARLWGPTSDFRGGTLRVYQKDANGFEHYKEVKIN